MMRPDGLKAEFTFARFQLEAINNHEMSWILSRLKNRMIFSIERLKHTSPVRAYSISTNQDQGIIALESPCCHMMSKKSFAASQFGPVDSFEFRRSMQ